jgi:hypothetical protein
MGSLARVGGPRTASALARADHRERAEIVIVGRRGNLRVFDVTEPVVSTEDIGTIVRVEDVNETAARALEHESAYDQLTADFA